MRKWECGMRNGAGRTVRAVLLLALAGMAESAALAGEPVERPPDRAAEGGPDAKMLADLELLRDLGLLRQLDILRTVGAVRAGSPPRTAPEEKGTP